MTDRNKRGKRNVNLKVDNSVRLVDIIGVVPEWETEHRVRALEINGRTPALDGLAGLMTNAPGAYKRIMRVIKLVAGSRRVANQEHVKADEKKRGGYEMRGGQARLFFFYSTETNEIVVCTNYYWKAKPSAKEQDNQFARCAEMKVLYEASRLMLRMQGEPEK